MASVDKVKVGSTSYDISPSKNGTLNGFTSNDAASPTAWTATNVVAASDSNSTIFSKVTTMIKNVRWLYSKLGTTDFSATGQSTVTGALSALQTGLNGKAASSHKHTTAQLPVSSSQTNSNSYIPTSALVYSMQQQITSLNDALSSSSLPSVTEDDNGSSLIAYNGQWIVINNGKIFQYNISNSCPSVWNNRSKGWSNKPLSVNLDSKYSYITLDSSTDFKIIGSDSKDDTNGSLSFPVSATCTKGNSRTIGPSSLSYVYGCYATLSFTSDNIVELQFGFSSAAQRTGLSFYSTGALIFRAYV